MDNFRVTQFRTVLAHCTLNISLDSPS